MVAEDALSPRAEINVTPLVDVVLVLLIIFLVITPLLHHGYDVTIPRTEGGDRRGLQIVVSVGPQGVLYLNRELVTRADLTIRLTELLRSRPLETVFFFAEDDTSYEEAVSVMDLIRSAGAARIGTVLTPPMAGQ